MSTYETRKFDVLNKRVKCVCCKSFAWGNEVDSDGCCDAKGCRATLPAQMAEVKKVPMLRLVLGTDAPTVQEEAEFKKQATA